MILKFNYLGFQIIVYGDEYLNKINKTFQYDTIIYSEEEMLKFKDFHYDFYNAYIKAKFNHDLQNLLK